MYTLTEIALLASVIVALGTVAYRWYAVRRAEKKEKR